MIIIHDEKKPSYYKAAVGEAVIFNCHIEYPHDVPIPYILNWNKEGQTIFSLYESKATAKGSYKGRIKLIESDSDYGKGSINLTNIRETDGGWYECQILFPNRSPITHQNGTWFHLKVEGGNVIAIPPINQTTIEGEIARFPCCTKENTSNVVWKKDGVKEEHSGSYTCTPFNELGTDGPSPKMNVFVLKSPVFTITPQMLYIRRKGESLHIPCEATEEHKIHKPNIVWLKNGKFFVRGNLTLMDLQEEDRGVYQCIASNAVTSIFAETEVMIENTAPRAPYNIQTDSTIDTITVKWKSGLTKPKLDFSVWYRTTDSSTWEFLPLLATNTKEYVIRSLQPGTEYEVMVLCRDAFGDGMFSKSVVVKTKGISTVPDKNYYEISKNISIEISEEGCMINWYFPNEEPDLEHYEIQYVENGMLNNAITKDPFYLVKNSHQEDNCQFQIFAVTKGKNYIKSSFFIIINSSSKKKINAVILGVSFGMLF
ncbi:neuronal cell adhesion molecule, putative [Pediculus humanus corporis]|uniref:Neuronal cell adhesion molecule, putative n=1 Tax=Pediculus humanus subsp. corporis TaxID=121224 RepID=E0VNT8_PEDHC|nr:neuronal cell adhesion molecule, putative [Pediculus humanus corporis]EEB15044.1 neuronal cell adhesion molecule, putative [Pediculus humanus corporis]